jgi:hypothetical protein
MSRRSDCGSLRNWKVKYLEQSRKIVQVSRNRLRLHCVPSHSTSRTREAENAHATSNEPQNPNVWESWDEIQPHQCNRSLSAQSAFHHGIITTSFTRKAKPRQQLPHGNVPSDGPCWMCVMTESDRGSRSSL